MILSYAQRVSHSPLGTSLIHAQRIAETVVGPVEWNGNHGRCQCPGQADHRTRTSRTDCKVVVEPVELISGTLAPGIYCYHDSCRSAVASANRQLRSALGRNRRRVTTPVLLRQAPKGGIAFDPARLSQIASRLPSVNEDWLARRSQIRVDTRTPASFLSHLYGPDERVLVFDEFGSQGQHIWRNQQPPFDARELDGFRLGKQLGVWFLANPVSGSWLPNDEGKRSRRSWQNVTRWRYLVLESDEAAPWDWIAALVQMPLPIASLTTSGGKSVHALVDLNAESKAEWESIVEAMKPILVPFGADRKVMSAVRLTRLPLCQRLGTEDKDGRFRAYPEPRLQKLLYLNPSPDATPIAGRAEYASAGPTGALLAVNDGYDGEVIA